MWVSEKQSFWKVSYASFKRLTTVMYESGGKDSNKITWESFSPSGQITIAKGPIISKFYWDGCDNVFLALFVWFKHSSFSRHPKLHSCKRFLTNIRASSPLCTWINKMYLHE